MGHPRALPRAFLGKKAKKTDAGGNGGAMEAKLSKTIMFRRGNGEVETVFTVAEQSRAGLAAA